MREKLNYAIVFTFLLVFAFGSYQLLLIASELKEMNLWVEYINQGVNNLRDQ